MRFYERNLFLRLSFTLAIIFITILIMLAWWQQLFDKTLNYYVESEEKMLEANIYKGMYQDRILLSNLLTGKKIMITPSCSKSVCIDIGRQNGYYQIHPDFEVSIQKERERRLRMFNSETSFLFIIVLLTIGYMTLVILREKKNQTEKEEFLAMTTHELKHPVSVLSLLLESLSRESLPKERINEFILKGLSEIKTLKGSLDNILKLQEMTFSKSRNIIPYDIGEFLRNIFKNWEMHDLNRNHRLVLNALSEKKLTAQISQSDLQVILNNLIENALLYSDGAVELSFKKDIRGVFIEVKDQGLGFNEEDKKNFQKMFYRSRRHDIQNIRGSGLGHFIIKKLLDKNSLHLILESEGENKGSAFKLYLK